MASTLPSDVKAQNSIKTCLKTVQMTTEGFYTCDFFILISTHSSQIHTLNHTGFSKTQFYIHGGMAFPSPATPPWTQSACSLSFWCPVLTKPKRQRKAEGSDYDPADILPTRGRLEEKTHPRLSICSTNTYCLSTIHTNPLLQATGFRIPTHEGPILQRTYRQKPDK